MEIDETFYHHKFVDSLMDGTKIGLTNGRPMVEWSNVPALSKGKKWTCPSFCLNNSKKGAIPTLC